MCCLIATSLLIQCLMLKFGLYKIVSLRKLRLMKTRLTRPFSIARTIVACLVACVFFSQSSLVASAHQRMTHINLGSIATEQGTDTTICDGGLGNAANKSGSHIHQSDCCVFCQMSNSDDNPSSILQFAEVIDILKPTAKETVSPSWLEYRPIAPQSIGLKSSWSAQAPPQA